MVRQSQSGMESEMAAAGGNIQHQVGEVTQAFDNGLEDISKLKMRNGKHVESTNKAMGQVFGVLQQVTEGGRERKSLVAELRNKFMESQKV